VDCRKTIVQSSKKSSSPLIRGERTGGEGKSQIDLSPTLSCKERGKERKKIFLSHWERIEERGNILKK
jgi:hypothetical protein